VIALEAARFEVAGVVQGVGFRPFVARLAGELGVCGWVRNDGGSVTVHAEGPPAALDELERALRARAPRLAVVDTVRRAPLEPLGLLDFRVATSGDAHGARLVPPDAATCAACVRELFDPADRRFRYPFINCTDCGPRFTVIEALPYDRERTSMRGFPLCGDCRREYEDPADRRFHAEPVACPSCGPRPRFVGSGPGDDPVAAAAAVLTAGGIVALKGLGGFHLACDATDEAAVARLRSRKRRPHKPFAVMVAGEAHLDRWYRVSAAERAALSSWRAPIVLVPAGEGLAPAVAGLAPAVAPGHRRHGVMLPSTPLHHLLTRDAGRPLVMTSGNATDEPICIDDDEALERLGPIADAFVLHDRPIVARYDDSVVMVRAGAVARDEHAAAPDTAPTVLRRARSFAPHPIGLSRGVVHTTLGTGAELHGAFCVASGRRAFLSQHVGDLQTAEAMRAYAVALERACTLFGLHPELVAHDLHPDLLTTRFAHDTGLPAVAVQHHHAHIAATMAEHGLEGEVLGIAFDGLGLGDDGTIWGGEFLRCTPARATRVGRLRPVPQPGGDAATAHPWRMAVAHALDAGLLDEAEPMLGAPGAGAIETVARQARAGLASPLTSSAGRLFDAVAALLGVCREATFEGQPAIELEQAADPGETPAAVGLTERDGLLEIDTRDLIGAVVDGVRAGRDAGALAGGFHASLAAVTANAAARLAREHGLTRVALGGGVFANDLLTGLVTQRLTTVGLEVFVPREVPVGDGGIALGQAVVAAARDEEG
jgi:hydrogenase maturation protein HypF